MKKRLLILLISVLSVVCAAVFLSACGEEKNPGGGDGDSSVDYKPGDSVIDGKDVEYEVTEGNVTTRYKDKKYEVTYLMDNASFLKLTGTKASDMTLSGYAGDIKAISLAEMEENIKIDEERISVTAIADHAFSGCETLSSVDLTKKNMSLDFEIGSYAFAYCPNITKVTLPTNIYSNANAIGNFAFMSADKLTSVTIGDKFSTIGQGAFAYCSSLASVTIPDRVSVIERGAFSDCESLASVKLPAQLKSVQAEAFRNTGLTAVSFGGDVRYIGDKAFYGTKITTLKLPASVTYVGDRAFYNCYDLTATEIPFIGNSLQSPTTYTTIYGVDIREPSEEVGGEDEAEFADAKPRTVIVNATAFIPQYAFKDCNYLTSAKIVFCKDGKYKTYNEDGVTFTSFELNPTETIGASAFYGCDELTTVSVPTVTSVGDGAFYGCKKLTDSNEGALDAKSSVPGMSEGLLTIGRLAYSGCPLLTSVVIPSTVTSVGDGAFADCAGLTSLEVKSYSGVATTGTDVEVEYYIRSLNAVSTFFGSTTAYKETSTYQHGELIYDYGPMYKAGDRFVPDSLTTIKLAGLYTVPQNMFNGWVSLETVELGFTSGYSHIDSAYTAKHPRMIGANAFFGCNNLAGLTVTRGDVVTAIGASAFYRCAKLPYEGVAAFTLPETVGAKAFGGCAKFTEVTIPSTVTSLGENVFYECPNITKLTVGAYSYREAGYITQFNNSFQTVYGLFGADDTADDFISSKYAGAYNGAYVPAALKTVTLNNVYALAANAFSGMNKLTDVTVKFVTTTANNNTPSVGVSVFSGCESLTALKLDSGTKNITIGTAAFQNCNMLTELEVRATSYPKGMLSGCNSLAKLSINIPSSSNSSYAVRLGELYTTSSLSSTSHASYVTASLKTVKLLDGNATAIPANMFYNCKNLESVEFGNVESIGQSAFYGCDGLDTVTAGGIVTYNDWIVGLAETTSSYVRAVVIPATIKGVGDYVFNNTSYLKSIYYRGTSSAWHGMEIGSANSYLTNATLTYLTAANSVTEGNIIYYVDPESATTPKTASAIYIDSKATAAEIKNSVTIGGTAYDVTAIASYAGYNQQLKYVYLPVTIEIIGSNAFVNTGSLRIYYAGTQAEWNTVSGYSSLSNAGKHYETANTPVTFTFKDGTKTLKTVTSLFAEYYVPEKTGNRFAGWYTDSLLTSSASFPYYGTENKTFYAKWTQIYTVKFVSNGGTSYADQTTEYGDQVSLVTPSKSGYTFAGWYKTADFGGYKVTTLYVTGDTTLYAKWTKNK